MSQTLSTPWPIGTALAQAPDRSRRRPGSGLHCHTVDLPEKGTKLDVTWGAAMINPEEDDVDKAPAQGSPAMPVAPRRALPISPPKAAGAAAIEI